MNCPQLINACCGEATWFSIPFPWRKPLLEELQEVHPDISLMKSRACTLMWWPNIDKDIEQKLKSCVPYQTR